MGRKQIKTYNWECMIKANELRIGNWKKITNWPDYEISDNGEIYSIRRKRLLKIYSPDGDYARVTLSMGGNEKTFTIHRLVALAYIRNPDNKIAVNHIDGNKHNNHVSNLEWCTFSENQKHAIRTGLAQVPKLPTGIEHPCAKLNNVDIAMIRVLVGNGFTCDQIAKRFMVHPSYVSALRTEKRRITALTGEDLKIELWKFYS